ncbi:hypothetical protein FRC14_000388 [Serendipita sp. 396]|nr:hypothetical protein FRC14_000388 [Serendipita sp. 396]KAG8788384.1 hypothetical protein FRC15_004664 [Serendipita sp. 397]KAG8835490.1 hypothetical protein FRC18_000442 [Serendipita sp. 400]KAG8869976.1 hypothetical protein FRC20_000524 [Serendipita sp. 405]
MADAQIDTSNTSQSHSTTTADETLPPLTDYEARKYGSLGVKMQYFHDMLQSKFEAAYKVCIDKGVHICSLTYATSH